MTKYANGYLIHKTEQQLIMYDLYFTINVCWCNIMEKVLFHRYRRIVVSNFNNYNKIISDRLRNLRFSTMVQYVHISKLILNG